MRREVVRLEMNRLLVLTDGAVEIAVVGQCIPSALWAAARLGLSWTAILEFLDRLHQLARPPQYVRPNCGDMSPSLGLRTMAWRYAVMASSSSPF